MYNAMSFEITNKYSIFATLITLNDLEFIAKLQFNLNLKIKESLKSIKFISKKIDPSKPRVFIHKMHVIEVLI